MAGSGPHNSVERAGSLLERGPWECGQHQDEGQKSQVGEGVVSRMAHSNSQGSGANS